MGDSSQQSGWLPIEYEQIAAALRERIRKLFPATWSDFTPHDPGHFERVERIIHELIPSSNWHLLSPIERLLLALSAWTHDIGMNSRVGKPDTAQGEDSEAARRRRHAELSAEWVMDNSGSLGLSESTTRALAELGLYHTRKYSILDCPSSISCDFTAVRLRLLASYLRLADAIDVSRDRVAREEFIQFSVLSRLATGVIDETLFHWIKSFVVSSIDIRRDTQSICVNFEVPEKHRDQLGDNYAILERIVLNELREELQTVEETLDEGGLSSFHRVLKGNERVVPGALKMHWPDSLPRVINYVKLTLSPNATELTNAAISLIEDAKNSGRDRESLLISLEQAVRTLERLLETRQCYNALHRLKNVIVNTRAALNLDTQGYNYAAQALNQKLASIATRLRRNDDLRRYFGDAIQNKSIIDGQRESLGFFLFGCSGSVAQALLCKTLDRFKISIWIAECRPKSQHGAYNTAKYLDAERYVEMLASRFGSDYPSRVQIRIIPDASVGTLFERARKPNVLEADRIDAVLFGVNGIYYDPEVCVAHTAGHLSISLVAKEYCLPVIALGNTLKIMERPLDKWEESQRSTLWLTSDVALRERLKKLGLDDESFVNYREDHVPWRLLDAIVTEEGCIVNDTDAGRRLNNCPIANGARETLRQWYSMVEQQLNAGMPVGYGLKKKEDCAIESDSSPTPRS